ncbi:hypothetical protein FACS1894219_00330 [Clostridia bacterium]|nr:hypothetical protein FACS1894219_00330 [Clostridia bacterium]
MQEQVNEKAVALYIKGGKITGRVLAKAMQAFLKQARASPKPKLGKQSVKSLTKQGASLSNIEISGDNIGTFQKTAWNLPLSNRMAARISTAARSPKPSANGIRTCSVTSESTTKSYADLLGAFLRPVIFSSKARILTLPDASFPAI